MTKKVRKAVIPVAGLGTRFLPLTKAIPKELLPLVDKPVIQHIVEEAANSGIEEVIFVVSQGKEGIRHHFDKNPELERILEERDKQAELASISELSNLAKFTFVHQHKPLGLGHAVLQAKEAVGNESFIVFGGDDVIEAEVPAARQLINVYEEHQSAVMGVIKVPKEAVSRYGIVDPAEDLGSYVVKVKDIIEKPELENAPSRLGVSGRWLLTPEIFDYLEKTEPGSGNEIQLTDAIHGLLKSQSIYAKEYEGVYWDCGNKLEYIKAMIAFALKNDEFSKDIKEYIQSL